MPPIPDPSRLDWTIFVPIIGALVGIIGMALRAFLRLQRRQEERDDAVAAREKKNLQAIEDIAGPIRRLPAILDAQGEAIRVLRAEQQHSFRTLSEEIRETGANAREATRELIAEIRAAFRGNHRT